MRTTGDLDTYPARVCGLYVHVPFCKTKCGYCDFYSVVAKHHQTGLLVDQVSRELGARVASSPCKVRTVFWGGGTPTILPLDQLSHLLEALGVAVPISEVSEFTVEANPATVDDEKARLLVGRGVSRVSMGAQSFVPQELATLGRIHSPDDTDASVAALRRNGIRLLNIDLIFGIPAQTIESWSHSVHRVIELEPEHVACYGLTYEPGTRLAALRQRGRITPVNEDLEAEMYLYAVDALAAAGYEQYETSNFSRPGCRCEHNLIYWRNGPYIGVGPSAAGCLNGRRYKNVADVDGYIRMMESLGHAEAESEVIDGRMLMTEMIMMQLRLVEGLSVEAFRRRTGVDLLSHCADTLGRLASMRLITVSDSRVALTRSGRLVSDAVIRELAGAFDRRENVPPVVTE